MSILGEVVRLQIKLYSPQRRKDVLERLEAFVKLPSPTGIEPWAPETLLYRGRSPLKKVPEGVRRALSMALDPIGANPFLAKSGLLFDILPEEEKQKMLSAEKKIDIPALRHALRPVRLGTPTQELAVLTRLVEKFPPARKMLSVS